MNILLICGSDHQYGSAQAAISLLKYTGENCPELRYTVLTQTQGGINELCDRMGIPNYVTGHAYSVVALDGSPLKKSAKRLSKRALVTAKNKKAMCEIEKRVDMKKIDLIHTNIDRDIIGCYLAEKYKIPHVMHLREFATGHYSVEPLYSGQYSWYNGRVDRYIAISKAVGANWEEIGLDPAKISVVYDGIDVSAVRHRAETAGERQATPEVAAPAEAAAPTAAPTGAQNRKATPEVASPGRKATPEVTSPGRQATPEVAPPHLHMVMCGDLSSLKGQDQTVRALAAVKGQERGAGITLDLFGEVHREKHYREDLEKIIREARIENSVAFQGYSTQLADLLCRYDCGVVCSKREGFGLATAEFMAAGLCVIASDTGANRELIEDGVSGLIYKYNDTADLAQKILKLYREPQLVDAYGRTAMKKANEKFSIEANCKGILDVYESVTGA